MTIKKEPVTHSMSLRLNKKLIEQIKALTLVTGKSVNATISEAIREHLEAHADDLAISAQMIELKTKLKKG